MKNNFGIFFDFIYEGIFDFLFPKSERVRLIEKMTVEEYMLMAKNSDDIIKHDFTIIPLLNYKEPLVKDTVWEIKYRKNRKLIQLAAEIISSEIPARLENESAYYHFEDFILVPIPLSKKRFKFRGYNQAQLITKELQTRHSFISSNALEKIKETKTQTSLGRSERIKNQKDAFRVKKEMLAFIKNQNIIILDDVTTTGATLEEAKKVLMKAGARRVVGVTLAH